MFTKQDIKQMQFSVYLLRESNKKGIFNGSMQ